MRTLFRPADKEHAKKHFRRVSAAKAKVDASNDDYEPPVSHVTHRTTKLCARAPRRRSPRSSSVAVPRCRP